MEELVFGSRGDFLSLFLLKIPADGIGARPDGPGARIVSFTYLMVGSEFLGHRRTDKKSYFKTYLMFSLE